MAILSGGGQPQTVDGTYVATGAAVTVSLGFEPSAIYLFNVTDGGAAWSWNPSLPAAHAIQHHATAALVAAAGFTVVGQSVTFGTALATDAKTFRYVAMR